MKIGAQLYTVREYCKTPDDLSLTLKKISDIGYRYVQVSGTCEYDPAWLDSELKKNDLSCVITHTPSKKLIEKTADVIAEHKLFGCDYIGLGYYNFDRMEEKYDAFVKTYAPVAKIIADGGAYFMYHNHASEFQKLNGKTILQKLSEDIPSDILGFTLDTYWIQVGGADPAHVIETMSGRAPCIHLKDCAYGQKMAVVGEGNINFDRVFKKAEEAGVRYMLVEQDDCGGEDPFECLARSYGYLISRGFE